MQISRRDMLKGSALAALGAIFGPQFVGTATAQTTEPRIQLGSDYTIDDNGDNLLISHETQGDIFNYNPNQDRINLLKKTAVNTILSEVLNNDNYIEPQVTASEGTSYDIDLSIGNYHKLTMTGDVTIDITNEDTTEVNSFVLHIVQDGTGSRTPTFTPSIVWNDGLSPSWSTEANAEDIVTFLHDQDGNKWVGFIGGVNLS